LPQYKSKAGARHVHHHRIDVAQHRTDEPMRLQPRRDTIVSADCETCLEYQITCCSDNAVRNTRRSTKRPIIHQAQQSARHSPPPPPYSLSPPTSDTKDVASTSPGLLELYESIIAADAQTIQVQQQTLASHQDIIRSQSEMIMKLRHLLEEQDRQIEEVNETRGLRCRRPGMDGIMRSRSS
jgi:hypothetical protein